MNVAKRTYPLLYQGLDPELWRKYVARTGDGCFALTTPSQSKCRLLEAAADIDALLKQFYLTEAVQLDSYRLLERVFEEQCERIQDTEARGVAPEHMVADTHYGSNQCLTQAKAKGVTLLAPAMSPKGKGQGKLTLEDFELDTSGHIQRCPAGRPLRRL